jgi:transcriptional regulator with XRE-family HTH domain
MTDESFGARVRRYRKERGFSQEKLAELVKRSRPVISLVESDRRGVSVDLLRSLCGALQVDANTLLGIAESDAFSAGLSRGRVEGYAQALSELAADLSQRAAA